MRNRSLLPSESQIQSAAVSLFEFRQAQDARYCNIYAVPNGGYGLTPQTGARLKREGLKRGVPDLIVDVAMYKYHGLRIEVKKPNGDISAFQQIWERRLISQGYAHAYCTSTDQIIKLVELYFSCDFHEFENFRRQLEGEAEKLRPRPKRLRLRRL
jgi:hypothetical protein